MPSIDLNNLTVFYKEKKDNVRAINDVSHHFEDGLFHVIIGYSGCGKTTLLKSILGLLPYDGDILINGVDSQSMPVDQREFSYVPQQYILYPHMTIFDNIAFPLKNAHAPREEILQRVEEIGKELGLDHTYTRKPKHLSGGQQQRVALARALIKRPSLIAFDEPLSNIDPNTRSENRLLIKKAIKARGITALYVTHDIEEAMSLADVLHVMNEGKIVISGQPKEIFNSDNPIILELKKALKEEKDALYGNN